MGLKKYILASIVLIVIVSGYTFSLESGDYRVQILDKVFILPVAIWVILPTLLLFLTTIIHILYYGLKNYFAIKAVSKDTVTLETLINKKLLNETTPTSFKNENFKKLAEILNQLNINVNNDKFNSSNNEINKTVEQINSIKSGKFISTKELKLDNNNPIMVENLQNRIKEDEEFSLDVVKNSSKYSTLIVKKSFLKVLETKSITTIKKLIDEITFDSDMLIALFKKDSEQKNDFAMTNDIILKLIKKTELTNKQLIKIANFYKLSMTPDQIIKLYEDISVYNEDYMVAYLYVLSQYEMIDKMRDILDNSAATDYIPFKALVDLKDAGKHSYSLDSLCYQ